MAKIAGNIFYKTGQVLSGGNRADGAGQNVVKEQRGDRELGQRAAHGLLDHPVDAATHEHAAGLDVQSPNRVAEQHYRQDEPRSTLADDFLSITSGIVRRGRQV